MNNDIYLGIDCDDDDFQVAYLDGGKVIALPLPRTTITPVIFYDPYASISSIGVGFPALLRHLGSGHRLGFDNSLATPDEFLGQRLGGALREVANVAGRAPRRTIVAVPATLTGERRRRLLDLAKDTGLEDVSLIDRTTAAVVRQTHGDAKPRTVLAVVLGYGDCEYALVRVAKGRCRVLGAGSITRFSGQALDALVIESIVLALRAKGIFIGLKKLGAEQWLALRAGAQDVRNRLLQGEDATISLPPDVTSLEQMLAVRFSAAGFGKRIEPFLAVLSEALLALLDDADFAPKDVDDYLLTGQVAESLVFKRAVHQALERDPLAVPCTLVAEGAAVLAGRAGDDESESRAEKGGGVVGVPGCSHAQRSITLGTPDAATAFAEVQDSSLKDLVDKGRPKAGEARGDDRLQSPERVTLATLRGWCAEGRAEDARLQVRRLRERAQKFETELDVELASSDSALSWLNGAFQLLQGGDPVQAVGYSHEAYKRGMDKPHIFSGMMKVHCRAGLALGDADQFQQAIQILQCALGHDNTDKSVHEALAKRYLQHARALRTLNNLESALDMVQRALTHDPGNADAEGLDQELQRQIDGK